MDLETPITCSEEAPYKGCACVCVCPSQGIWKIMREGIFCITKTVKKKKCCAGS